MQSDNSVPIAFYEELGMVCQKIYNSLKQLSLREK